MRGRESEALMPAVADCLSRAAVKASELSRVVCGSGPGSFTSLRIAASIAKGVAAGACCPLFAVSSLALLAGWGGEQPPGEYLAGFCPFRGGGERWGHPGGGQGAGGG